MSMISAQCDELRTVAESIGLEVPQAATLMMEAADTIWELRNRCSSLVDKREPENAELRQQLADVTESMGRVEELCRLLGPGTCQADETDTWECVCDGIGHYGERVTIHVMECSECGRTYEHVNGGYECCPHCRRRIVEVADG